MDSSPSPHQFESLNQEDKAESTAGEGVESSRLASPPTSLLDLPDELLASVFDQVWESLRPKQNDERVGILVPLSHILVNKRIFAVARPLWFRHLTTPDDYDDHDRFLSNLLRRRDLHPLVHSLHTEYPDQFPALHSSVIGLLSNLSSLFISFENSAGDNDAVDYLPTCLTDMLRTLNKLQRLRVIAWAGLENEDFHVVRNLNSLQHLDIDGLDMPPDLLSGGASQLTMLTIRSSILPVVPWASLKRLALRPYAGEIYAPDQLIESLEAVGQNQLPLQHLVLAFSGTFETDEESFAFHRGRFAKILELLQQAHLERLDLADVYELKWEAAVIRVPSLKVLSLKGVLLIHGKNDLAHLNNFLSMFPCLRALHLEGFTFTPGPARAASALSSLSPVSLAIEFPHLFSLLFLLRSTKVLEFRLRGYGEAREVRWTRNEETEEFARECWTLE
ncbi:hypothetical protein JCM6882_000123 [Rhodosporidiobolus microsporus]